jgi:predicted amidohydrolase
LHWIIEFGCHWADSLSIAVRTLIKDIVSCDVVRSMIYHLDTHVLINHEGSIVSSYRKLHLFDVDLSNKVSLKTL